MKPLHLPKNHSVTVLSVFIFVFFSFFAGSSLCFSDEQEVVSRSNHEKEIQSLMADAHQLFSQGDYYAAEKFYAMILDLDPKHKGALFRMAVCRQYQDDYDKARDILEKLALQYPKDVALEKQLNEVKSWQREQWMTEANRLFYQDSYENAEKYYDLVLEIDPEDRDALFKKAVLFQYKGQYRPALEILIDLYENFPDQSNIEDQIWQVLKWQQSGGSWSFDIPEPFGSLKKGIVLKNQGEYDRALQAFTGLLDKFPDNLLILGEIAETQAWHESYSQSVATYRKILKIEDSIPTRLKYAEVLAWAGRYEEAKTEYQKILSVEPGQFGAKLGLAEVFAIENNYTKALQIYKELVAGHADSFDLQYGLARLHMWMDKLDEARKKYEQLERSYPNNILVKLDLQRINYWQGLHRLALQNIDEILRSHPGHSLAQKLQTEINSHNRPFYEMQGRNFRDSGKNGFFRLSHVLNFCTERQNRLWFQWDHWRTDDPGDIRENANVYGIHHYRRWSRPFATQAAFSLVQLRQGRNDGAIHWQGGIHQFYNPIHALQIDLDLSREYVFETSELIDRDIHFDNASFNVEYKIMPRNEVFLGASISGVSDGNQRKTFFAGSLFRLTSHIRLLYRFRYLGYREDLDHGYFDPQKYVVHEGRVTFHRDWDKIKAELNVGIGLQSINRDSFSLTGMLNAVVQYEFNNDWMAEGYFSFSNSAIDSATGYSWYTFNARILYRF